MLKDFEELIYLDLLKYKGWNIKFIKCHQKYLQINYKNIPYKIMSKSDPKLK